MTAFSLKFMVIVRIVPVRTEVRPNSTSRFAVIAVPPVASISICINISRVIITYMNRRMRRRWRDILRDRGCGRVEFW